MKILKDLFLIGSGKFGFSSPYDCNIYLLDGHSEIALIDTGCGLGTSDVIHNIKENGLLLSKIKKIILTHAHADHSGGTHSLLEYFPSIQVFASCKDKDLLEFGSDKDLGLDIARQMGIYPHEYQFNHSKVDTTLNEGDIIAVGDYELSVLCTPGHSAGSICLQYGIGEKKVLFSGDTLSADGSFHFNSPDLDLPSLVKSVERLNELHINTLMPGHGLFVINRGDERINDFYKKLISCSFEQIAHGNPFIKRKTTEHGKYFFGR